MKILIVGAGAVGFNLAKQLSGEGHTISVIESAPHRYRKITEELDVFCVDGNGNSPSVLEDAGIKDTMALGERMKEYLQARKGRLRPETQVYLKRLTGEWEEVI